MNRNYKEKKQNSDIRNTVEYKKMTSYLATAIAEGFCEGEGASEQQQKCAWQYLSDTGLCWNLQGWYGRTVSSLIEQGIILPPIKTHNDYYGNVVIGN